MLEILIFIFMIFFAFITGLIYNVLKDILAVLIDINNPFIVEKRRKNLDK